MCLQCQAMGRKVIEKEEVENRDCNLMAVFLLEDMLENSEDANSLQLC